MILFQPSGVLEALLAAIQRGLLRALIRPAFAPRWSIPAQRRWLEWMARTTPVPRSARITAREVGGVPGEWVSDARNAHTGTNAGAGAHGDASPAAAPGRGERCVVLYLHGGAYCIGSPATHRALTARISRALGCPVFVPHYRLAPEHPFPAGLDDALAAYRALRRETRVIVAGDSAGGGLSLATALALREAGDEPPAALMLLSPWADIEVPDNAPPPPAGEAMLSADWARACSAHYRGGQPVSHPLLSPLRADLRGLPPTLIQAGTDEMLHAQALELEQALQSAGVQVRCEITQGRWHVFQMHGGMLRSADEAIERMAAFAHAHLRESDDDGVELRDIAILGAGMSGLCMAIQAQRAGRHDYVILEKQPGLGGTWWDNTYPGAHVDVPAPLYSFSFAPNPDWSRRFASAPEIQAYMRALAQRHGIDQRIRLNTRLEQADFDADRGLWTLRLHDGSRLRARYLVCSTGPLNQPRWPDIAGLDSFAGARVHSARWDHTLALEGRRVAVIGTGSTASQLLAPVAARAARVHLFQRTANWVLPRIDRPYTALDRALARLPLVPRLVRWAWMMLLEWGRRGFDEGTLARRGMLRTAGAHLRRQVRDPSLRARLRPPYPLGCKRIIYSNDFYPALTQPHVELVTQGIERITPGGIVTADGRERPVDVLVCATGFDTQRPLSSLTITGLGGRTLAQAWADGPQAYHGVSVSGFPNLFLLLGPNTATGHTSTLLYIEPETRHVLRCMQAVRERQGRWIEVQAQAMDAHNQALQRRLDGSVWSHCRSWYRTESGRITALFPGFTAEYVRGLSQARIENYRIV